MYINNYNFVMSKLLITVFFKVLNRFYKNCKIEMLNIMVLNMNLKLPMLDTLFRQLFFEFSFTSFC